MDQVMKIDFEKLVHEIDEYLKGLSLFGFSGTVFIGQGDEILLNKGYGFRNYEKKLPMLADTVMSIGSISKQFTAVGIMKLADMGEISIGDTLDKYFDDVPQEKKGITIHHLLTHTSGINDQVGENTPDDFDYILKEQFIKLYISSKLRDNPGEKFSYSNVGYSLLAMIIEKVTNKSYQEFLLKDLFEPLGIKQAGWFSDPKWTDDNSIYYYKNGENMGSIQSWSGSWSPEKSYWAILGNGGVCISNPDLYIWIRALMTGKIISLESLEKMLTPDKNNYGYGWDIEEIPMGTQISHDGGSDMGVNAVAKYLKELEMTILINSNVILNGFGMAFQLNNILPSFFIGEELPHPPKSVSFEPLSNEQREKIVGTYHLNDENYVVLSENKLGQLVLNVVGQEILNSLSNLEPEKEKFYPNFNLKSLEFGKQIINSEWEKAFSLYENPEVKQSRIDILVELRKYFEKEYGTITGVTASGTIPFRTYFGMTHLMIHGEKGKSGLPIVWNSPDKILGFRPMLSDYPLSIIVAQNDDGNLIGFDPSIKTTPIIEMANDGEITLICNENKFYLTTE